MKAVMLAAGVGRRLRALTRSRPKCLIDIGGRSLLYRAFDALRRCGVTRICLVVGYQRTLIHEAVAAYPFPLDAACVVNAGFERGSVGSLWAARREMDDDVVIMDADLLFHRALLDRLLSSPFPNVLLADETVTQQTEECMVAAREGRVAALSKRPPKDCDHIGEGAGLLRVARAAVPALLRSVGACVQRGLLDLEYEDALEEFFREIPVGFERIGGLPWIEIDFPEDVERAQRDVLPRLEEAGDDGGTRGRGLTGSRGRQTADGRNAHTL